MKKTKLSAYLFNKDKNFEDYLEIPIFERKTIEGIWGSDRFGLGFWIFLDEELIRENDKLEADFCLFSFGRELGIYLKNIAYGQYRLELRQRSNVLVSTFSNIEIQKWYHVYFSCQVSSSYPNLDLDNTYFYVNSEQWARWKVSSIYDVSNSIYHFKKFTIGGKPKDLWGFDGFIGYMTEIYFFNDSLDPLTELLDYYNNGVPKFYRDKVLLMYQMRDGVGLGTRRNEIYSIIEEERVGVNYGFINSNDSGKAKALVRFGNLKDNSYQISRYPNNFKNETILEGEEVRERRIRSNGFVDYNRICDRFTYEKVVNDFFDYDTDNFDHFESNILGTNEYGDR